MNPIMEQVRYRIAEAIRKPDPAPVLSAETLLLLLSMAYGGVMRLRARLYQAGILPSRALPCRVVSIGNITAGGTGKTPMTIMVAQRLKAMGHRVVVASRGYRGRMEADGGVVSDGRTIFEGPEAAGDEPHLMARVLRDVPVVVGRDRYAVGLTAVKRFKPDVIVLDDAFQHLRLRRDLNLVLLDSRSPYGNGHLLPRGALREPLSALRRADAIVFTRSGAGAAPRIHGGLPEQRPVVSTTHIPVIRTIDQAADGFLTQVTDMSTLHGRRVAAFAGLADNDQFFAALAQAGCILEHTFVFADHHRYENSDLARIAAAAGRSGAELLVTSLKDYVKIEKWLPALPGLVVVDVAIEVVGDETTLNRTLSELMSRPAGAAKG